MFDNQFWIKVVCIGAVTLNIILLAIIICQRKRRRTAKYSHVDQFSCPDEENVHLNK